MGCTLKKKKPAANNGYNGNSGYAPLLRVAGDVIGNKEREGT